MSKFVTISIIMIALIFLLHIMGIQTGVDSILTKLGLVSGGDITLSQFTIGLGVIVGLAAGVGAIAGFFLGGGAVELAILAGSFTTLSFLFSSINSLIGYTSGMPLGLGNAYWFIFAIVGVFWIYSLFEFIFNR